MFSLFKKIKMNFQKTHSLLSGKIRALFGKPWNEETFHELEQILYEADLGSQCVTLFVEHLKKFLKKNPGASTGEILDTMQNQALEILTAPPKVLPSGGDPLVFLIVGVNGSGKTTSIAKLAKQFQNAGKKVLLAAGDTFRAAAIEQLSTWAERLHLEIVKSKPGSDPAAVSFDALSAGKARGVDVILIDTAGRLQNKTDLMNELEKIQRTCQKVMPLAPHETILVLDATVGQNALDQAKIFNQFTPLTGILLAKLDGSAKGGIVLSIYQQLGIPIRWIGIGETPDDLTPFDPHEYVSELFSKEESHK